MSKKGEIMEDKYASKAVNFKNESRTTTTSSGDDFDQFTKMSDLGS